MGMSLFFMLSGFLIATMLLRGSAVFDFLVRRAARILPLYFLYILLVFLFLNQDMKQLFWSALFTINYKDQYLGPFTAHLWSLCVEVHFYVAVALLVLLFGKRAIWSVWVFALLVTALRVQSETYISIFTHVRVDEILTGACIATLHHQRPNIRIDGRLLLPLAFGFHLFCCLGQSGPFQYLRPWSSSLVLAAAIWSDAGWMSALLRSRPARYVAEISYALYIFHPATAYGWMNEGSTAVRYLVKRPISFALTFALAHLSTFYWERYWRQAASKYLKNRFVRSRVSGAKSS
jgi:peptidoglycan/LPS O-acetylase OafA/YrhL